MVTSEGLASVETWLYRQGFNVDSWLLHDAFSHDSDMLARALNNTVSAAAAAAATPSPHTLSPSSVFFHSSTHTPSSNISGGAKRKHNCSILTGGSEGKAMKRRSRASKKPQTTFITADPSNFRQMVQQVTGSKYMNDNSSQFFTPIVKPEPHRLINRLSTAVPTLDTSAFLSTHHQQNLLAGNGSDAVGLPPAKTNAKSGGGSAAEFDPYPTFPTLESWKVM